MNGHPARQLRGGIRPDSLYNAAVPRPACLRCRRPESACFCARLGRFDTRTRVVFLQHPRERRVAIGTARMAHLMLPNSELHVGTAFGEHARLRELAASGEAAVLFPAEDARDVETLAPAERPRTLVVVDGSWHEARKLLQRNPVIRGLPRVGFTSDRTSHYRIRREPEAHCLSTIEATVEMLGRLEGDAAKFTPMLRAFDYMVELQLAHWQASAAATRYGRHRNTDRARVLRPVTEAVGALVVLAAEANAHPRESAERGEPELIHLVAKRLGDGAAFGSLLQPLRPLGPSTAGHVELSPDRLAEGEPRAEAGRRWREFVREGDVLATWGTFPLDLLAREGLVVPGSCDLRVVAANWLRKRPGAIEGVLRALGSEAPAPTVEGRAGRVLAQLEALVGALARCRDSDAAERARQAG